MLLPATIDITLDSVNFPLLNPPSVTIRKSILGLPYERVWLIQLKDW
jgi:hypothetical protein